MGQRILQQRHPPVGQIAQQRDLAVGAFQLHHRYVALAGGHQQLIIDAVIRSQPQLLRLGGLQDHRHLPQRLAVEQPDRQAQLAGSRL